MEMTRFPWDLPTKASQFAFNEPYLASKLERKWHATLGSPKVVVASYIDPVEVVGQCSNRWASNWPSLTRYILKIQNYILSIIYKYITNIICVR